MSKARFQYTIRQSPKQNSLVDFERFTTFGFAETSDSIYDPIVDLQVQVKPLTP
jgi:hypothetical protein